MTDLAEVKVDEEGNPIEEATPELDADGNPIVAPEPELDDEGNPIKKEKPLWQREDDQTSSPSMPVTSHIKKKNALKGQIKERDTEIETLRQEVASLKGGQQTTVAQTLTRPNRDDFDDNAAYDEAYDVYRDKKDVARYEGHTSTANIQKAQQAQEEAVDAHYERADELIQESGISPDTYKASDAAVRKAVDTVFPGNGDGVVDHLISTLGKGSEKVMHYIGINTVARNELIAALTNDKDGLQAAIYLGRVSEKIAGSTKATSQARKPAAQVKGDEAIKGPEGKFKKKYNEAKSAQDRYDIKKAAKIAGHDTSSWK